MLRHFVKKWHTFRYIHCTYITKNCTNKKTRKVAQQRRSRTMIHCKAFCGAEMGNRNVPSAQH